MKMLWCGVAVCRRDHDLGLVVAAPAPEHRRGRCALGQGRGRVGPVAGTARRWRGDAADRAGGAGRAWGLRLALHLWHRVRSEPEDGRYQHLREHWHGHQGKFFGFFQFQALLVALFALPFVAVARAIRIRGPGLVDRGRGDVAAAASAAKRWPTASWRASAPIRPTAARPAATGCGATRGIPTISSNGCTGSPTCCSPCGSPLWWLALVRAGADVRVPALGQRHSLHRGAGAALARRRLPRLPAHHADAVSVVPLPIAAARKDLHHECRQ